MWILLMFNRDMSYIFSECFVKNVLVNAKYRMNVAISFSNNYETLCMALPNPHSIRLKYLKLCSHFSHDTFAMWFSVNSFFFDVSIFNTLVPKVLKKRTVSINAVLIFTEWNAWRKNAHHRRIMGKYQKKCET